MTSYLGVTFEWVPKLTVSHRSIFICCAGDLQLLQLVIKHIENQKLGTWCCMAQKALGEYATPLVRHGKQNRSTNWGS